MSEVVPTRPVLGHEAVGHAEYVNLLDPKSAVGDRQMLEGAGSPGVASASHPAKHDLLPVRDDIFDIEVEVARGR